MSHSPTILRICNYFNRRRRPLPTPRFDAASRYVGSLVSGDGKYQNDDDHLKNGDSSITERDGICEIAASNIRYGPGGTSEIGLDLLEMKVRRVLLFVDPHVATLPCAERLMASLERHVGLEKVDVYDGVHLRVEPNDTSFKHAIEYATARTRQNGPYDAVVAMGGGSTMDAAKVANLYACHPPPGGDFYHYVNPPIGQGAPVPGPLPPLICVPTTSGTGSETTGVAIFDDSPTQSKTGVAHRRLKPALGIVDPDNLVDMPSEVAKYSGLDVLCHAVESYTALPSNMRPKPASPLDRPAYQGSNPISDVWSLHALKVAAKYLPRLVRRGAANDAEARSSMALAASAAGVGFGNAGVHLCHGMSYAVASQVKLYKPPGYPDTCVDHPMVPHGHSVIVNAPAVFRFTGRSAPERHLECARILRRAREKRRAEEGGYCGGGSAGFEAASSSDPGAALSDELLELMSDLNVPIGLRALGYGEGDVESLAQGTLPQHRVTKLSPRQPVGMEELRALFVEAMDG